MANRKKPDFPNSWLAYYRYRNTDKLARSSLGSLSHKLTKHVHFMQKNRSKDRYDNEDVYEKIKAYFKTLRDLFYCGPDGSIEVDLAESIFRYKGKPVESYRSDFDLKGENADKVEYLKALVSAIHYRTEYLATRHYGRRYTKDVEMKDPKTKKTVVKHEIVDDRHFRKLDSDAIHRVFDKLDELESITKDLIRALEI